MYNVPVNSFPVISGRFSGFEAIQKIYEKVSCSTGTCSYSFAVVTLGKRGLILVHQNSKLFAMCA